MLRKGAVEPMDQLGPGYYSRQFLVEKVRGGGGGLKARCRSICVKPLHHPDEVQDGDGRICSWVNSLGGLDVLHRPEGRVFSVFNPSGVSTVPSLLSLREVCISSGRCAFWPIHSSTSVHQSLSSGFGVGALEGHASPSLPRRLAGHCGVEESSASSSGLTSSVVR